MRSLGNRHAGSDALINEIADRVRIKCLGIVVRRVGQLIIPVRTPGSVEG